MDYRHYLRSPQWRAIRAWALARSNYACERCEWPNRELASRDDGWERHLNAHHVSYNRLGREHPEDIEVLCDVCHLAEHISRDSGVPFDYALAGFGANADMLRQIDQAWDAQYVSLWPRKSYRLRKEIEAELETRVEFTEWMAQCDSYAFTYSDGASKYGAAVDECLHAYCALANALAKHEVVERWARGDFMCNRGLLLEEILPAELMPPDVREDLAQGRKLVASLQAILAA